MINENVSFPYKSCPFSKESELAVVSSILRQGDKIHEAMSLIDPEDFFIGEYKTVYLSMIDLKRKDKSIDVLSVADELRNRKQFERVGGIDGISVMKTSCLPLQLSPNIAERLRV